MSAQQVYSMAQERHQHSDWQEAWPLYRYALDLDLYRFRADSGIRESLRRIATQKQVPHLDADWFLREGNPAFESDRIYLLEHVHLTFAGRVAIANAILAELYPSISSSDTAFEPVDPERIAITLLYTPKSEFEMWSRIVDLYRYPVFRNQPGAQERVEMMQSYLAHLRQAADPVSTWQEICAPYHAAVARRPWDAELHFTFAHYALDAGMLPAALAAIQNGLRHTPRHLEGLLNLARIQLAMSELEEAEATISLVSALDATHRQVPNIAGQVAAIQGDYGAALPHFQRATEFEPHSGTVRANLGLCYLVLGKHPQAIAELRSSLSLGHSPPSVLNNLAWALLTQPHPQTEDIQEALVLAGSAVDHAPLALQYQGTLALAEAASGDRDAAQARIREHIVDDQSLDQLLPELLRWQVDLEIP